MMNSLRLFPSVSAKPLRVSAKPLRVAAKLAFLALPLSLMMACEGEVDGPDPQVNFTVPSTYDFENVNYDGQQQRIAQLSEMKVLLRAGNAGQAVDAARLKAMYVNGPDAGFQRTYTKDLASKTLAAEVGTFNAAFDRLGAISVAPGVAAPGTAGLVRSADGTRSYLLDSNGVEWAQVIEKGLMGACFYYQATAVYLSSDKMNVDNSTIIPGEGTAMQHHWDEAFGYLGAPTAFPTVTEGAIFWGDYAAKREAALGLATKLSESLRRGRAAIGAGDLTARDQAITDVRRHWEEVAAASAISYLNLAIGAEPSARMHALSEAISFAYATAFNPDSRMDIAVYRLWLNDLAGGSDFKSVDLWSVTDADLIAAREQLAARFGLTAVAPTL